MNDEVENTNPCREINLPLYSGGIVLNLTSRNIPTDEERWYNFIYRRRILTNSVRILNKCGIEVDYDNRNKIVHEQR